MVSVHYQANSHVLFDTVIVNHSLLFEGAAGAVDDASRTLLRSKSWWLKRVLAVSGLVQSLGEEQHLTSLFGNAKCELTGGMVLRRN